MESRSTIIAAVLPPPPSEPERPALVRANQFVPLRAQRFKAAWPRNVPIRRFALIKAWARAAKSGARLKAFVAKAQRRIHGLYLGTVRPTLARHFRPRAVSRLHETVKTAVRALFRVSSLWVTIALFVLIALEICSPSGRILDEFGAGILSGWLGQLILLCLIIDAIKGGLATDRNGRSYAILLHLLRIVLATGHSDQSRFR